MGKPGPSVSVNSFYFDFKPKLKNCCIWKGEKGERGEIGSLFFITWYSLIIFWFIYHYRQWRTDWATGNNRFQICLVGRNWINESNFKIYLSRNINTGSARANGSTRSDGLEGWYWWRRYLSGHFWLGDFQFPKFTEYYNSNERCHRTNWSRRCTGPKRHVPHNL